MQRKEYRMLAILGGVSLIGISIFFFLGYRISTEGFLFPGKVSVLVPLPGSSIFVDGNKKAATKLENETIEINNLSVGAHTILVARTDFFPWAKSVAVTSNMHKELKPFLLPLAPSIKIISETDPRFNEIRRNTSNIKLPTENSPKLSSDDTVSVWIEGNAVYASWKGLDIAPSYLCETKCDRIEVLLSEKSLYGLDFYQDKNDVVLIGVGEGIYALEINNVGIQNFQPVYGGTNPKFFKKENIIEIFDDGKAYEVSI